MIGANNLLMSAAKKRSVAIPTTWKDPWTINGDTGNLIDSIILLTGANDTNTDNGTLYWEQTVSGPTNIVLFFKDSAKTQLVAEASERKIEEITIEERNGSGLATPPIPISQIFLNSGGTDTDSGNTFVGTPC